MGEKSIKNNMFFWKISLSTAAERHGLFNVNLISRRVPVSPSYNFNLSKKCRMFFCDVTYHSYRLMRHNTPVSLRL